MTDVLREAVVEAGVRYIEASRAAEQAIAAASDAGLEFETANDAMDAAGFSAEDQVNVGVEIMRAAGGFDDETIERAKEVTLAMAVEKEAYDPAEAAIEEDLAGGYLPDPEVT